MIFDVKEDMPWFLLAIILAALLTICGGCTDTAPEAITDEDITVIHNTVTPTSSIGKQVNGNIVIDVPDFVQHWKTDGTCYWEGRIDVTNTGNTPEMNVIIRSSLIRVSDNQKESVDTESFQRINPYAHLSYVSRLNGNCDEEYYIQVKVDTD